jgi:hypothetical protein
MVSQPRAWSGTELTEASMEEREEAPCGADELALTAAPSSGDLNTGEMDE